MATGDQQMKDIEKGDESSSAEDNNVQQNETSFNIENDNVQLQPLLDGNVAVKSDNTKKNVNDEFYGLSKEELEKYAKDPKWVKIRWILFGVFMTGWLVMLVAAIVIVVVTPKCPPAPAIKWYQSGVMYKVKAANFQDSNKDGTGDLKGMENRCDHFENLGVESVFIEDLMNPGQVGLDKPDSKLGSLDDFKALAAALKKKGIRIVIDLALKGMSTGSKWFSDFPGDFLEKSKCAQTAELSAGIQELCLGLELNWEPVGGKQFYIPESDGDIARFDLSSENLQTRLEVVLKEWAAAGAEGFVVTSPEGQEAELLPILKRFQKILDDDFNYLDDRDRIVIAKDIESSEVKVTITNPKPNCTALSREDCNVESLTVIAENIQGAEDLPWRIPKIDSEILRNASKSQLALKLMIPGTPTVQYGDEIGAVADNLYMRWDDSSNGGFTEKMNFELPGVSRHVESVQAQMSAGYPGKSQYHLFKKLATLRQEHPSLLWGQMHVVKFGGDTLVFTREAQGHPVIVVALNIGSTARSGSIARDELTAGEVMLADGANMEVEDMFDASAVYLPPDGVLVVRLQEPEE